MCKSTDKSLLSTMHINKERNILGVVGELIKFHMLYLIIKTLITTTFLIPCGGVHLEELELCENVYFFCCCRSTLGHQRKKFFICWRRKGIKSVNWKQRLQVNRYSKTPLNEPILFVDLLSTTHVVDQCDQGKQQTL